MMKELHVQTSTHPYTIHIDEKIRFRLKDYLVETYSSIFIITDDTIAPLYLQGVMDNLQHESIHYDIIPSGEASKNIETYYRLQTKLMEAQLDRKSLIIALGGGVIGDIAGFVAATFMRGIDYVQVPTTILSHDSSVGGKVAINHELGKNMIGCFYPPKAVIYDITTLHTLPAHEVRSGYAELIKEAYIYDEAFLQELFTCNLQNINNLPLIDHLYQGIAIKANIVEQDEKESNIRMFLNFGHTLAHAIEASLGYGKITHGEAVAIGMLFALYISEKKYQTPLQLQTYYDWLKRNGYQTTLPAIPIDQIIQLMKLDKKAQFGTIQMVLLEKIGKPLIVPMTENEIADYLRSFKEEWNIS